MAHHKMLSTKFLCFFRLLDSYRKLHKFADVISYFSLKSWTFHDDNTRGLLSRLSKLDQNLFQFDICKLQWDDYFEKHVVGIRKYILHDSDKTFSEGKKHMQRSVQLDIINLSSNITIL